MFADLPEDERTEYLVDMLAEPAKLPAFAARLGFECDDMSAAPTRDDALDVYVCLCKKTMEFPANAVHEAWLATYKPNPGNMPDVDERTRLFLEQHFRDNGKLTLFLVLLRIEPTLMGADRIAGVLRMCQEHNVGQTAFRAAVTSFCNLLGYQDPGAAPCHPTGRGNLVPFVS